MTITSALQVADDIIESLFDEARRAAPAEACGILYGTANRITAMEPAANVHPARRTHFEIDPQALINAHRTARTGGPQVIGYYHSHPSGPPEPSATDRAMAHGDGKIWAIIGADRVQFWRDQPDGFTSLSYAGDQR